MRDDPQRRTRTPRRSVLSAVVGGALVGLAGCTGGDGSDDGPDSGGSDDGGSDGDGAPSGTASSEGTASETATTDATNEGLTDADVPEFTVDESAQPTPMVLAAVLPDDVRFLDEFTVELAVANVGGAAIGDRSVTVEATFAEDRSYGSDVSEPDPVAVDLPEIGSGEWAVVEADLRATAGGDWTLTADVDEHPEFDPSFAVAARRLDAGDSVASGPGHFEITALEPRFERALHYETEEGGVGLFTDDATGLLAAGDGHALVVHRFRVENTSDERSLGFGAVYSDNRFTEAEVTGTPTGVVTDDDLRDDVQTLVVDGATAFDDNEVAPGETAELFAVQEVPETDVADASVTLSLWGDTEDVVFDAVDGSPPLPAFELVDASLTAGEDDPVIEVTVENVGEAAGTFRGVGQFYHSRPTAPDWAYLPEGMAATVDPGERVTVSTVASRGEERYRIAPFGAELSL